MALPIARPSTRPPRISVASRSAPAQLGPRAARVHHARALPLHDATTTVTLEERSRQAAGRRSTRLGDRERPKHGGITRRASSGDTLTVAARDGEASRSATQPYAALANNCDEDIKTVSILPAACLGNRRYTTTSGVQRVLKLFSVSSLLAFELMRFSMNGSPAVKVTHSYARIKFVLGAPLITTLSDRAQEADPNMSNGIADVRRRVHFDRWFGMHVNCM
jgi:hypothetical protein